MMRLSDKDEQNHGYHEQMMREKWVSGAERETQEDTSESAPTGEILTTHSLVHEREREGEPREPRELTVAYG